MSGRIESSYPTPIHGVSTLAPRNRARGQAGLQVNMRSDPVAKLTRRPSLAWDREMLQTDRATTHHSYYRREKDFRFIVTDQGIISAFVDGVQKPVTGSLGAYGASPNLVMETVNDTTFIINPDITTDLIDADDRNTIQKVSHINITSALNYSTEFVVFVRDTENNLLGTATILIPDGVDNIQEADELRATNAVALEVARQISSGSTWEIQVPNPNYTGEDVFCSPAREDGSGGWEDNPSYNPNMSACKPYLDQAGGIPGVEAVAKGSTVAAYRTSNSDWLKIEIESGRADSAVAINGVIETVEGLPLYAIPGTRVTVKPDPTRNEGTYYLEAISLDGESTGDMQEVVWTETRSPYEPYSFEASTMPHTVTYDYDTDSFTAGESTLWEERLTGDNDSCPPPDFLGRQLTSLGHFQKRLVLLSDNDVSMSRTDNLYDWWKRSAVSLLVTDPIGVTSNSTGVDILQHLVEHNRDLLVIASNGQFKIDGTAGITPQTVAMPLTTTQEIQISVKPVPMGTAVYMPINYGESTGVIKYDGSRDAQDIAVPLTHHVIGYMGGEARIIVGSPNLDMLAMVTTSGAANEVYIYEQFLQDGKATQQSWSTWELPIDDVILDMAFRRDKLTMIVQTGTAIVQKSFNMYSRVATNTHEVFLDDFLELPTDGFTATLPKGYETLAMKVVMGENTIYPLTEIPFTIDGRVITFSEDIDAGSVYIGSSYRSAYRPTRPFKEDEQGIAVTTDRIRISRYILNVVETEKVWMHIDSKYYSATDQEQSPRILNTLTNRVGHVDMYTGDYNFSYSQDADLAEAEFYTDGYLGMTIAGISWQGQYFKSSGRM